MDFTQFVSQTRSLFLPLLESGSEDIAALTSAAEATRDALQNLPVELQARLNRMPYERRQTLLDTYEMAETLDVEWENEWHREFLKMVQEWLLLLPE
jgi:hypothetical protein